MLPSPLCVSSECSGLWRYWAPGKPDSSLWNTKGMDKASCSQCGQDSSTPCESCLPPEETRNQIPVPTHPVIHAHLPLLTLPTPVKFSNSLIFPLNPTDQAQVGPQGSLPFHLLLPSLSLYYPVDPQGQRHLNTHWKKVILWRKKMAWTWDGEWSTNFGCLFKHRASSFSQLFTATFMSCRADREATEAGGRGIHSFCWNLICASLPLRTALTTRWLSPGLAPKTQQEGSKNKNSSSGHMLAWHHYHQKASWWTTSRAVTSDLKNRKINNAVHQASLSTVTHHDTPLTGELGPHRDGGANGLLTSTQGYQVPGSRTWAFLLMVPLYSQSSFCLTEYIL